MRRRQDILDWCRDRKAVLRWSEEPGGQARLSVEVPLGAGRVAEATAVACSDVSAERILHSAAMAVDAEVEALRARSRLHLVPTGV
jgi:hypothetical protein